MVVADCRQNLLYTDSSAVKKQNKRNFSIEKKKVKNLDVTTLIK
jgi:hypothetical protein